MISARNFLTIAGLPLIALVALGSAPVMAQSDPAETDKASLAPPSESIVTPRKRDEGIVDVPIAITAMTGTQLERQVRAASPISCNRHLASASMIKVAAR